MASKSHPTGEGEAAKEAAHPAVALRFIEGGANIAGVATEGEGHPLVVRRGDIKRPPRQQRKAKARGVKNFDQISTTFDAFRQSCFTRVGDLRNVTDKVEQFAFGIALSE